MRSTILLFLFCLCLVPPVTRAEEADPVTSQVPKQATACIRLPSFDKLDAMAKEALPLIKAFAGPEMAKRLEQEPLSKIILSEPGIDIAMLDRTKPIYFAEVGGDGVVGYLRAAEGAAGWEGVKELGSGLGAVRIGGVVCVGQAKDLALEKRGVPTKFLPGDVSVHAYLGDLVAANKDHIEKGLNEFVQNAGLILPPMMQGMPAIFADLARDGVYGVVSADYALTWKGDILETEGRLVTKPGSNLNKFLARAGAPGDNPLVGYLPKDAFMVVDGITTVDWPSKELFDMLDRGFGEGMGAAFAQIMGVTKSMWSVMTGRTAMSISLQNIMMGGSSTYIAELKEGVDANAIFANYDVTGLNEIFKKFDLDIEYKMELNVGKHGETNIHRLSFATENPQMAMFLGQMKSYIAAEGRHLFTVMSATGEQDLKNLIDTVRAGKRIEHPHTKAMARLGRQHNLGMTINFGQLKQLAMFIMMMNPEMGQAFADLPDELYMSTSVAIYEGNLHWRGDWPVKQISKIVESVRAGQQPADAPAEDQEFD